MQDALMHAHACFQGKPYPDCVFHILCVELGDGAGLGRPLSFEDACLTLPTSLNEGYAQLFSNDMGKLPDKEAREEVLKLMQVRTHTCTCTCMSRVNSNRYDIALKCAHLHGQLLPRSSCHVALRR